MNKTFDKEYYREGDKELCKQANMLEIRRVITKTPLGELELVYSAEKNSYDWQVNEISLEKYIPKVISLSLGNYE